MTVHIARRLSFVVGAGARALAAAAFLVATSVAGGAASAATSAGGLDLFSLNGAPYGVDAPIHVLTFNSAQYALQIGLAHNAIDGGVGTPSSVCNATAGCVAAVNGDFFDVTNAGLADTAGDEVGGIIRNCVLLHTPEIAHEQVDLSNESVSNGLNWTSTVEVSGTSLEVTGINQELPMSYLGVNVPLSGTLLFTSLYALRTPSAIGRMNYEFEVEGSASPTTINSSVQLRFLAQTTKAVKVSTGRVDISAPTGTALSSLAPGSTVTLATTSTGGCNNIGGHPILFDQGVVGPINRADTYMASPYARTVVGWTYSGETVVMSVGGVDDKSGATMFQLVTMLYSLGVVTALDLDGGQSTTLYDQGRVIYPTARTERAVSTSLLIVHTS